MSANRAKKALRMRLDYQGEPTEGILVVEDLLMRGGRPAGELDRPTAESAIDALADLQLPWLLGELVEGGEGLAEQVHSDPRRGLQELIQNAQDQGAGEIRFGVRRRGSQRELLIAHDGDPVELFDVVAMQMPLISGSRSDPEKIGRFGVGLKTLNQFGDRLEVQCPPLPGLAIQAGALERVADAPALPGFWDPTRRETLFILHLKHKRFDANFFRSWLDDWDASSLIFLNTLRSVKMVDLRRSTVVAERRLTIRSKSHATLALPRAQEAVRIELRDTGSNRAWTVYRVRYPVPRDLKRTRKASASSVELSVASCNRESSARVYAGLPLEEDWGLPFSVSAPFNVDADRTALAAEDELNEWLLSRLADLSAAATEDAFAHRPSRAWRWVPTTDDRPVGDSSWLSRILQSRAEQIRTRLADRVRLPAFDGTPTRLSDFLIEAPQIEGIILPTQFERLYEELPAWKRGTRRKRALPKAARDSGRWRTVLRGIRGTQVIGSGDALRALLWPREDLPQMSPAWLLRLMYAAIEDGHQNSLGTVPCLLVEGRTERLIPDEVRESGHVLVTAAASDSLAGALRIAERLLAPFRGRSPAAKAVRSWLSSDGILKERVSDALALQALAEGDGSNPVDLSDAVRLLRRLRFAFEALPADEREQVGRGVGANITLKGLEFDGRGARRAVKVSPADAYIPYRIEKLEGWQSAAGKVSRIQWIADDYASIFSTGHGKAGAVKRQGALALLRGFGAVTAPRLGAGIKENADAWAKPPLAALTSQQRDELTLLPNARTVRNDLDSPDLAAVLNQLTSSRLTVKERRKRSRALFLCLSRAWVHQYAGREAAIAAHHYYTWYEDGPVMATWLGRLASEPWMSTRETRFTPKAPRELAILSEASYEIEGDNPGRYAYELEPEDVDSPVAVAIGIEGRPTMDTIVQRLEQLRREDLAGTAISHGWAVHCYRALAAYCPGGSYSTEADLDRRQLRARFGSKPGNRGLIHSGGKWLSIPDTRRAAFLGPRVPWVDQPTALWEHLDVPMTDVSDCAGVLQALAAEKIVEPETEVLVMRALASMGLARRTKRRALAAVPIRTYKGWSTSRPIFVFRDKMVAEKAGEHWPVWNLPVALDEISYLLAPLGLTPVGEEAFIPEVPATALAPDLQVEFPAVVTHLKNYLGINAKQLHDLLSPDRWQELQQSSVALGPSWTVRIKAGRKRSLLIKPAAYLFRDPLIFCARDVEDAGDREAGGLAVAGYFLGDHAKDDDRSMLSLAWESAFRHRGPDETELRLDAPKDEEESVGGIPTWLRRRQPMRASRRTKVQVAPRRDKGAARELVDLEQLDVSAIDAMIVGNNRRGKLRAAQSKPVAAPRRNGKVGHSAGHSAGNTDFSSVDREDAGYAVMAAYFAAEFGLDLEDVRSQGNVGADAIDHKRDVWVELKASGSARPPSVSLQPSEAKRAQEKGDSYWLVIVSGLEKPNRPRLLMVPNPLAKLDVYLGRGITLTGIDELERAQSRGMKRRSHGA